MSIINDSYNQWVSNPTPDNMGVLLTNLTPIIRKEAHRYKGPATIMVSKGKQLAIDAVKSYDPNSGAKLSSWVTTSLQPLNRYGRMVSKPVHVAESAYRQFAELHRTTQELEEDLGDVPTDDQIADRMGISKKKILKLRSSNASVAYDADVEAASDTGNATSSVIDDGTNSRVSYAQEAVWQSLDGRDKKIFEHKIGYNGATELDNKSIAKKLAVSPAFVSQRSAAFAKNISDLSRG